MIAALIKGQLTYIDTDENIIYVDDKELGINSETKTGQNWKDLIGDNVEVITIDGVATSVYSAMEE